MIETARALPRRLRVGLVLGAVFLLAAVAIAVEPIVQDPRFHDFADRRALWGTPNVGDVVSNAAFLLVGLYGFVVLRRARLSTAARVSFGCFFAGVILVSVGSSYYHWAPDDRRLFWDRLPMTVAFLSLVAAFVTDRIDRRAGLLVLPLLIAYGAASLLYWRASGDLNAYFLAQAMTALLVPLICVLFAGEATDGRYVAATLLLYALAIGFELGDRWVDARLGHAFSGHTVKHLVAALAALMPALMLRQRMATLDRSIAR